MHVCGEGPSVCCPRGLIFFHSIMALLLSVNGSCIMDGYIYINVLLERKK